MFYNVKYMKLDENGNVYDPPVETTWIPGIIWNEGLNTRYFEKNEGLVYEGLKISDEKAGELGNIIFFNVCLHM